MRIAVLIRDRCQPKTCSAECIKFCPKVRTGDETIVMASDGKPVISEELCAGCGICINKCPFDAIQIIGLPDELNQELVHQYGKNGFRLYRLPHPRQDQVIGLLGPNGIGKTTTLRILSGEEKPNLGDFEDEPGWDEIIDYYSGTELQEYLRKLANDEINVAVKPQYVDKIPEAFDGKVKELLDKVDEGGYGGLDEVADQVDIAHCFDKRLSKLSGGELQRVAIAATMVKKADVYFFDEPSSYLDIKQRLSIAKTLRGMVGESRVVVIEHDLAVLDFLSDNVYLMYGKAGAYGILAHPRPVRTAINVYLSGYMREENIRFRERAIIFESRPPRVEWKGAPLVEYGALEKEFKDFKLKTEPGKIHAGEVVGVVGPNATGKTTFVKMLAAEESPTAGKVEVSAKVSYKPQYIKPDFDGTVEEILYTVAGEALGTSFYQAEIETPLGLKYILKQDVMSLSGGELQRLAIALSLSRDADVYLIDEPSAYLDSIQRMEAAKTIRRVMEKKARTALIVDHDVYFIDLVSDSIMVFEGEPSKTGLGHPPVPMRGGMNRFLANLDITFRRDNDTRRPRINKPDSRLDREQKSIGEYYYTE